MPQAQLVAAAAAPHTRKRTLSHSGADRTDRCGCHIHVVSATWLGHPRLIRRGDRSGGRVSPVTTASRERRNTRWEGQARAARPGSTYTDREQPVSAAALCRQGGQGPGGQDMNRTDWVTAPAQRGAAMTDPAGPPDELAWRPGSAGQ